jgi:hypothetical protein
MNAANRRSFPKGGVPKRTAATPPEGKAALTMVTRFGTTAEKKKVRAKTKRKDDADPKDTDDMPKK